MAEKYTPNKPKDAGLEARQKLGWWHAYRFLILRRISQLSIILMLDRKSTRLNSSHGSESRMPSSA